MSALEAPAGLLNSLAQRRGIRQFVKFCIVGASSTAIDFLVFYLLIEVVHLQQFTPSPDAARALAVCGAFLMAVTNGFYWNNRWTFKGSETGGVHSRYAKFVLTNLIGLALNLSITLILARYAPAAIVAFLGQFLHRDPAAFFGKAVATTIVVFWNFTASKYWTFKK